MKQCMEPESTKAVIRISGTESERKLTIKEDVLERAEALSLTSLSARSCYEIDKHTDTHPFIPRTLHISHESHS